jgi:hypothetical protein
MVQNASYASLVTSHPTVERGSSSNDGVSTGSLRRPEMVMSPAWKGLFAPKPRVVSKAPL